MKLIYNKGKETGVYSPFENAIIDIVTGKQIDLVYPYLRLAFLKKIIYLSKDWRLLTDIKEWIKTQGKKEGEEIRAFIAEHSDKIRHQDLLHAKVIINESSFLMGSANLTYNGLTQRNEVSIYVEEYEKVLELKDWFQYWWQRSLEPSLESIDKLLESMPDKSESGWSRGKMSNENAKGESIGTRLKYFNDKKKENKANANRERKRKMEKWNKNNIQVIQDKKNEIINYWWFGINNKKRRKNEFVCYPEMESFLLGEQSYFIWRYGGTSYSRKFYKQMKVGDQILFWTGNGTYTKKWGIIGIGEIVKIMNQKDDLQNSTYYLKLIKFLESSFLPYEKVENGKTQEVIFLQEVFGSYFKPLGDVFKHFGIAKRNTPITIDKMTKWQFEQVVKEIESRIL